MSKTNRRKKKPRNPAAPWGIHDRKSKARLQYLQAHSPNQPFSADELKRIVALQDEMLTLPLVSDENPYRTRESASVATVHGGAFEMNRKRH